ncbi:MAG: hypothetical protein WCQ95_01110 [Bacteroidota bacterium]
MKTFFYSFVLVLIIFLASCVSNEVANSDTVKQSEIYQSYSVSYDSGEKELTATATFRFGGSSGTTLLLTKPADVTFDNEQMPQEQNFFSGAFYQIFRQTNYKPFYSFVYGDCDKNKYANTACIVPVEISKFPVTADKSKGIGVEWVLPLRNNENITLYVEDNAHNTCSDYTNIVGTTSLSIKPSALKNIVSGLVNIYLIRESNSSLENATHLGGNMYSKYTSKKIGITLTGTDLKEKKANDSSIAKNN